MNSFIHKNKLRKNKLWKSILSESHRGIHKKECFNLPGLVMVLLLLFGNSLSAQRMNKAIKFDGKSVDKIEIPNFNHFSGMNYFSIEAWIYVDTWQVGAKLFEQGTDKNHWIAIELSEKPGELKIYFANNDEDKGLYIAKTELDIGHWQHVAVTYKGGIFPKVKVYVNGEQSMEYLQYSIAHQLADMSRTNLIIGEQFKGKIDEIRCWSKVLSQQEIKDRYKGTIDPVAKTFNELIAYWNCDGDGDELIDSRSKKKVNCNGRFLGNTSRVDCNDNPNFFYREYATYMPDFSVLRGDLEQYDFSMFNAIYLIGTHVATDDYAVVDGKRVYAGLDNIRPTNHGLLKHASIRKKDLNNRRAPFLHFNGNSNSFMNCGKGMLITNYNQGTVGVNQFTFEGWIYISKWREHSFIFNKKGDGEKQIALELGDFDATSKKGKVKLSLSGEESNEFASSSYEFPVEQWIHVATVYDGNAKDQLRLLLNGQAVEIDVNKFVGNAVSKVRADLLLGQGFEGYMDEVRLWHRSLSQETIKSWMNDQLNKKHPAFWALISYWKIDGEDVDEVCCDSSGWEYLLDEIRAHTNPNTKIYLCVANGPWQKVLRTEKARQALAVQSAKEIENDLDIKGVDYDFEWPNKEDWGYYNELVRELNKELTTDKEIRLGLKYNGFLNVDPDVDKIVDAYTIQVYEGDLMNYIENFAHLDSTKFLYGQGLFGWVDGGPNWGYKRIVEATIDEPYENNVALNADLDLVTINNQQFILTGRTSMRKKTQDVLDHNWKGIFLWVHGSDHQHPDYALEPVIRSVISGNN
ncbi:hypothetical protein EYV94_20175 [Puteibacter caeruleilacunae]|nr:hypothetical protein EYV94_20175 [Puteibacter caeruleilacunae]